tara:strand:- start:634 stop:900 length:267 start_codon:yes stop_codon:yes gene_type:complete
MAIAVVIDERPATIGNLHVVTGTYAITGSTDTGPVNLSSHLSTILSVTVNPSTADDGYAHFANEGDTTFDIKHANNDKSGRFTAIGFR